MNPGFLFLLAILIVSILVFVWGTTDYLRCYTDTPGDDYHKLCPMGMSSSMHAFIATFVIIGIAPIMTWMKTENHRFRTVFTALSGAGMFFAFVGIMYLILLIRN